MRRETTQRNYQSRKCYISGIFYKQIGRRFGLYLEKSISTVVYEDTLRFRIKKSLSNRGFRFGITVVFSQTTNSAVLFAMDYGGIFMNNLINRRERVLITVGKIKKSSRTVI